MTLAHPLACSLLAAAVWTAAKRARIRVPGLGLRIG
jgi:hypothetical protein